MTTRIHVPFDTWSMPVGVQVSQFVRDGDLAWSCGQCPLDDKGQVLFPGNLSAQAERVCDYVEHVVACGDLASGAVAKLVIYHIVPGPAEVAAMLAIFRQRFGDRPLLVPVAVPHFYYDGMMIEVDVFASAQAARLPGTTAIEAVDGGDMLWVTTRGLADAGDLIGELGTLGVSPGSLLCAHWFQPEFTGEGRPTSSAMDGVAERGLLADRQGVVQVPGINEVVGELTFVRGGECQVETVAGRSLLVIHTRRSGRYLWVSGTSGDETLGLVGQTKAIMPAIGEALARNGMTFDSVVKSTTHYVGSASPEDLHENLAVRHSFYRAPGPASTGLPVAALGDRSTRIAIDIIAAADG